MHAVACDAHVSEGVFPEFVAGTPVDLHAPCQHFAHWWSCTIAGQATYIPDYFVVSGKLNCNYNPTEIETQAGDHLQILSISHAWLIARNARTGKTGWIPAEKVISTSWID